MEVDTLVDKLKMFRLVRPCHLLGRSSIAIVRLCTVASAHPAAIQRPSTSVQAASREVLSSGHLLGDRDRAHNFGPEVKTEESVLAHFNGLLNSQQRQLSKGCVLCVCVCVCVGVCVFSKEFLRRVLVFNQD